MKEIGRGAEAILYKEGDKLVKDRISKGYRIKELDDSIRSERTKREASIMTQANRFGKNVPRILSQNTYKIDMEFIEGNRLKELINSDISNEEVSELAKKIGEQVGKLHKNSLIHGDLTTSNMILNDKDKEIYFIDFGLSFFSNKIEDKAVDLHLLRQALESKHYRVFEKAFKLVLEGYKEKSDNYKEIMQRLEKVEERGRNKHK